MAKAWYRNFKWKSNPFFVKSNPNLVGVEKEKESLMNHLDGRNMCFIQGDSGMGKTSLLKWAELKVNGTSIYMDCEVIRDDFDLDNYVKAHRSLWKGFFGSSPKNVILLIDEAQASTKNFRNAVKLLWESETVKSVVFSQTHDIGNMSTALRNRIGKRIISLSKMNKEDALEMIESRTKMRNPFEKEAMLEICEKSNYIPRVILENCERICISLSKRGGRKIHINLGDVEEILGRDRELVKSALGGKVKEIKKLSPMETKIIEQVKISGKTIQELAKILGSGEGSVGKQISKLVNSGEIKVLSEKRPKVYGF